jgi:hypothetical protein
VTRSISIAAALCVVACGSRDRAGGNGGPVNLDWLFIRRVSSCE